MKFIKSFLFAFNGIWYCMKTGRNFKIQIATASFAVVLGLFLKIENYQWLAILICISLVITLEMCNTAIEQLCNEITADVKPSIKIIKDVAAGAVLVASIAALIVGFIIFGTKFIK